MKNIILFILIAFCFININSQNNPVCRGKRYLCDINQTVSNYSSTCARVYDLKNQIIYLDNCPFENINQTCNWENAQFNSYGNCSDMIQQQLTLPGEFCQRNIDCQSGTCINNICIGNQFNQSCNNDTDCDVGLYCSDQGSCQNQNYIGQVNQS